MASATVATATIQRAVLLAVIVMPSLFRLPADRSGERRPFGFLGVDVGRIVFRRAQPRLGALVGEPLAHLVGRERRIELAVATVGTSGSSGERLVPVVASARSFPAAIAP